jgi:hypothetical protein
VGESASVCECCVCESVSVGVCVLCVSVSVSLCVSVVCLVCVRVCECESLSV